jgi:hypothetical protein
MIDTVYKASVILVLANMTLENLSDPQTEQDLHLQKTLLEIKRDCLEVLKGAKAIDLEELKSF